MTLAITSSILRNLLTIEFCSTQTITVGCICLDVEQEEGVLRGQELENAVLDADYTKAIQLAFELRRPHKLFELFASVCR